MQVCSNKIKVQILCVYDNTKFHFALKCKALHAETTLTKPTVSMCIYTQTLAEHRHVHIQTCIHKHPLWMQLSVLAMTAGSSDTHSPQVWLNVRVQNTVHHRIDFLVLGRPLEQGNSLLESHSHTYTTRACKQLLVGNSSSNAHFENIKTAVYVHFISKGNYGFSFQKVKVSCI